MAKSQALLGALTYGLYFGLVWRNRSAAPTAWAWARLQYQSGPADRGCPLVLGNSYLWVAAGGAY